MTSRMVKSLLLGLVFISGSVLADQLVKRSIEESFVKLEGVFSQGGLLRGEVAPGSKVLLDGTEVRVTPAGRFTLGFGRDAEKRQSLSIVKPGGKVEALQFELIQREYVTQSITGVPQKTVTPSEDKLKRIRQETALVKAARKQNSDLLYFLDTFVAPMKGPITGVYGSQRIYNGVPKRPHFGVDYAGPVGSPVFSPAGGKVSLVHDDMFYSGGTLIIDHGYGLSSTFIHLSEVLAEEGQVVKQGDLIAKVGSGGRSTGPHLDWRVNWYQTRIDPQLVLLLED